VDGVPAAGTRIYRFS